MGRATEWIQPLRRALTRGLCALVGHRPIKLESELHTTSGTRWRFRCGDCERKFLWP